MIKTKGQILSEGKYDTFTKKIVNDIMSFIKETEGIVDNIQQTELSGYYHEYSGIEFDLEVFVNRVDEDITYNTHNDTKKEIPFYINTFIADDDFLIVEITINNNYGRKHYQEIYFKLNEDIRHELEHYVQNIDKIESEKDKEAGIDRQRRFRDREQPLIQSTSEYETTYEHHQDPSEVEALVRGFYRRSKLEKMPLNVIMTRDLAVDVELGHLTTKESEKLFSIWMKYARRNLPYAKYTT